MKNAAVAVDGVLADGHFFEDGDAGFVYVTDGGAIHAVPTAVAAALSGSLCHADLVRARLLLHASGMDLRAPQARPAPVRVPVRSISLAIAAKCNLGCGYCYAEQGGFGSSKPEAMSLDVAREAITGLLRGTKPGDAVRVIFLGGEPLFSREALRAVTLFASEGAESRGVKIDFAITTNATMLTVDDAAYFDEHAFALTVSVDGIGAVHDSLRPFLGGRGSFDRIAARVGLLLDRPARRCTVQARVSVTPSNLALRQTFDGLLAMGFDTVHFSPVLRSPSGAGEMGAADLEHMLEGMRECADADIAAFLSGSAPRLTNLWSMVSRIAQRQQDDYPCAAGGTYAGVSADGGLYACHRFVGDEAARLGDIGAGVDAGAQKIWLAQRHVTQQTPCNSCWARHLCGGGCHFEAMGRGRSGCDFIRGWLEHCLRTFVRLRSANGGELARYLAAHARAA